MKSRYKRTPKIYRSLDVYGGLNLHVLPAPVKVCALLYSAYRGVISLNQYQVCCWTVLVSCLIVAKTI